ncbi:deoxyribose-phosphate aldolase [Flavobacterium akiainvivens]|uniref:Deoxyribose-phosphate aldolase n=1 Tax=Flavobacterium akiainvivens TaxID=1202724 RepID=A0A0M8MKZ1_9FLAO|nr:deoxyribose-phosphate aldolase [Flavobacterium akiainvivens]KOS07678.1 deoxyribose-phosphate aldolase [Flavobacterium akiainvivens]
MDIRKYLDATYLKTAEQAGVTAKQNREILTRFVQEAVEQSYKLVMVRPDMVGLSRNIIDNANSNVLVGTVIDFPDGNAPVELKMTEAAEAINNGVDELDFVVNYTAFINGKADVVAAQVKQCTALGLNEGKVVKWIIEVAALNNDQIAGLTVLIRDVVLANFKEADYQKIFVKSSTGFYKTEGGKPNGATPEAIKVMLDNSGPLSVKAAGGVRNYEEAVAMVNFGVMRIGTSAAKQIVDGETTSGGY